MDTIDSIDHVVRDVLRRVEDNWEVLGDPEFFYEKIEDPAILAEDHLLPTIHVIPFAEGIDSISPTIGLGICHHDFAVTIIGTYETEGVDEYLSMVRRYGYACSDLFRDSGSVVGPGYVYKASLRFGVFVVVDKILQQFYLTLHVKMYDEGTL